MISKKFSKQELKIILALGGACISVLASKEAEIEKIRLKSLLNDYISHRLSALEEKVCDQICVFFIFVFNSLSCYLFFIFLSLSVFLSLSLSLFSHNFSIHLNFILSSSLYLILSLIHYGRIDDFICESSFILFYFIIILNSKNNSHFN